MDTKSRFQNRVAAEVTRLKPFGNQSLLTSAATVLPVGGDTAALRRAGCLLLAAAALMLGRTGAEAQVNPPLVKVFGFTNQLESVPTANLLLATNGMLYGTAYSGGPSNFGGIFRLNPNGSSYAVLRYFTGTNGSVAGANPEAGLLEGGDGFLYGTTFAGGNSNAGCVFRLQPDGGGYTVLKNFTGAGGDGANPTAALVAGTNGLLYGTTAGGGSFANGTIFSLNKDGSGYAVRWHFDVTNGANPSAALLCGSDGRLYGVTESGGAATNGTVFALNHDGSGFTNLWNFSGAGGDGANPPASLIEDTNGVLYGMTYFGGSSNAGSIYKLGKDGSGYAVLYSFLGLNAGDADSPNAALKLASDGALYGTTLLGGTNGAGTVFKLNPDGGGYAILHHFAGGGEGRYPQSALLEAADGALYATTGAGGNGEGGTLFKLNKDASGFATVKSFYAFAGGDGFYPADALLPGSDGKLYGTTVKGGEFAGGTVFGMNPDGSAYQLLKSFGASATDGTDPRGGLVEGVDGALYGATYSGGASNAGTVFRLNHDGSGYGVLLHFGSITNDAQNPYGGLVQGTDGQLYGTTVFGGTNKAGTVFRVATNGTGYAVLRSFGGAANSPTNPFCRLVESPAGTFYGTTADGGTNAAGTVFKINSDGSGFAIVRSFAKDTNGWRPLAGVIRASDGLLYGMTAMGGTSSPGTVYQMATNGSGFAVVKTLTNSFARAGILEASDGGLYGAAYSGAPDYGIAFMVKKDGADYAVARTFGTGAGDGQYPKSALVQANDGSLFGTAAAGGAGWGAVYVLPWQPVILGQPQTQVLLDGNSALLSVAAAAATPLTYQWWFNGAAVPGSTNATLPFSSLDLTQAGNYQVVVANAGGSVTSAVASVSGYRFEWATNQSRFTLAGPAGAGYRIDVRNELASGWSPLTNLVLDASPAEITDPDSGSQAQRYYRLVLLP